MCSSSLITIPLPLTLPPPQGEIEQHLINEVKFPSLSIFRPGLLLTDRQGESRFGERMAQKIVPFFHKVWTP